MFVHFQAWGRVCRPRGRRRVLEVGASSEGGLLEGVCNHVDDQDDQGDIIRMTRMIKIIKIIMSDNQREQIKELSGNGVSEDLCKGQGWKGQQC